LRSICERRAWIAAATRPNIRSISFDVGGFTTRSKTRERSAQTASSTELCSVSIRIGADGLRFLASGMSLSPDMSG
jgi:hypothetical protein